MPGEHHKLRSRLAQSTGNLEEKPWVSFFFFFSGSVEAVPLGWTPVDLRNPGCQGPVLLALGLWLWRGCLVPPPGSSVRVRLTAAATPESRWPSITAAIGITQARSIGRLPTVMTSKSLPAETIRRADRGKSWSPFKIPCLCPGCRGSRRPRHRAGIAVRSCFENTYSVSLEAISTSTIPRPLSACAIRA